MFCVPGYSSQMKEQEQNGLELAVIKLLKLFSFTIITPLNNQHLLSLL